jgi:hypothetical protein
MNTTITKEQLIRIKILPRLERLSDDLFDHNSAIRPLVRKLDSITEELITILNQEDN